MVWWITYSSWEIIIQGQLKVYEVGNGKTYREGKRSANYPCEVGGVQKSIPGRKYSRLFFKSLPFWKLQVIDHNETISIITSHRSNNATNKAVITRNA